MGVLKLSRVDGLSNGLENFNKDVFDIFFTVYLLVETLYHECIYVCMCVRVFASYQLPSRLAIFSEPRR